MALLTVTSAAARVERSERTIYRWAARGLITIRSGLISERELLIADRQIRAWKPSPAHRAYIEEVSQVHDRIVPVGHVSPTV